MKKHHLNSSVVGTVSASLAGLIFCAAPLYAQQPLDGGDGLDMESTGDIFNMIPFQHVNPGTVNWLSSGAHMSYGLPAAQFTGMDASGNALLYENLLPLKVSSIDIMVGANGAAPTGTGTYIDDTGVFANGLALWDAGAPTPAFVDILINDGDFQVGGDSILTNANAPTYLGNTFIGESGDGSFLREGVIGTGAIPKEGAGTRMMWHPNKAAFRTGHVAGTEWDDSNVGLYSVAMGINTVASGEGAVALGAYNEATGDYSFAAGCGNVIASGWASVALGAAEATDGLTFAAGTSKARMSGATALGSSEANGYNSTAIGAGIANNWASMAIGMDAQSDGVGATAIGGGWSNQQTLAAGNLSTAMGIAAVTEGEFSYAIGNFVTATSYGTTAMGNWNENRHDSTDSTTINAAKTAWQGDDEHSVFEIGIGTGVTDLKNAMTVFQDGSMELGNKQPDDSYPLQVLADGTVLHNGGNIVTQLNAQTLLSSDFVETSAFSTILQASLPVAMDSLPNPTIGGSELVTQANAPTLLSADYVSIPASSQGSSDSFLKEGTYGGAGSIPKEGAGVRMMWYPEKAAFRAGRVDVGQWDDSNVGACSVAFGHDNTASGPRSAVFGIASIASGSDSFAAGFANEANGKTSIALGESGEANGSYSIAMGYNNTANGMGSFAAGYENYADNYFATTLGAFNQSKGQASLVGGGFSIAEGDLTNALGWYVHSTSYGSTSIGRFNENRHDSTDSTTINAAKTAWQGDDEHSAFEVGIGTSNTDRKNGLTVLQDGTVEVGKDSADNSVPLVVNSDGSIIISKAQGDISMGQYQ